MSKISYAWFDDSDYARLLEELNRTTRGLSDLFQNNLTEIAEAFQYYFKNYSFLEDAFTDRIKELYDTASAIQTIEMPAESIRSAMEALDFYNSPTIVEQMKFIASAFPDLMDQKLIEAAVSVDLSELQIQENDILSYNGVQYTPDALHSELEQQVALAKSDKASLRARFEELKQKLWLVLLLLNLILLLPDIPEKVEFYHEIVSQALDITREKSRICFTINERSYLREDPNSGARIILVLRYDTPLEILDDIPRWYKVKYTREDGSEEVGWISKISVDYDT